MIMTQNRGLKAAIRRRMAETGEPYTEARRAILEAAGDLNLTPEEQYGREAAAAGASAEEIEAALAAYRQDELTGRTGTGGPGPGSGDRPMPGWDAFGRAGGQRAGSAVEEPGDGLGRTGGERAGSAAEQLAEVAERLAAVAERAQGAAGVTAGGGGG
jgi:hypothetical protein